MKNRVEQIYVWPDGAWCAPEDLEAMLTWRSDDVVVIPCASNDDKNDRNALDAAAGRLPVGTISPGICSGAEPRCAG